MLPIMMQSLHIREELLHSTEQTSYIINLTEKKDQRGTWFVSSVGTVEARGYIAFTPFALQKALENF